MRPPKGEWDTQISGHTGGSGACAFGNSWGWGGRLAFRAAVWLLRTVRTFQWWLSAHGKVCGAVAFASPRILPTSRAPPGAQWKVSRPPLDFPQWQQPTPCWTAPVVRKLSPPARCDVSDPADRPHTQPVILLFEFHSCTFQRWKHLYEFLVEIQI